MNKGGRLITEIRRPVVKDLTKDQWAEILRHVKVQAERNTAYDMGYKNGYEYAREEMTKSILSALGVSAELEDIKRRLDDLEDNGPIDRRM